ncbi:hypothetical protein Q2941_29360 [Bradyrhizobium sp. UFLA05-153]
MDASDVGRGLKLQLDRNFLEATARRIPAFADEHDMTKIKTAASSLSAAADCSELNVIQITAVSALGPGLGANENSDGDGD